MQRQHADKTRSERATSKLSKSKNTPLQRYSHTNFGSVATTTGNLVLQHNGVIRNLINWGIFDLPHPKLAHQVTHYKGHYFHLTFDAGVPCTTEIKRTLKLNPHMINFGIVKLGDKLGGNSNERGKIENVTGALEWNSNVPTMETMQSGAAGQSSILDSLDSTKDWRDQLFEDQFQSKRPTHVEQRALRRALRGQSKDGL